MNKDSATAALRDQIMKVLYDHAGTVDVPWLTDEMWDAIMEVIEKDKFTKLFGVSDVPHFTLEQCNKCNNHFEVRCPDCREWISNPYVPIIQSQSSRIRSLEAKLKIARSALEEIAEKMVPCDYGDQVGTTHMLTPEGIIAQNALSLIK